MRAVAIVIEAEGDKGVCISWTFKNVSALRAVTIK